MTDADDDTSVTAIFRTTAADLRRLDACAARETRSRSQMIRVMVDEGIQRRETQQTRGT